MGENILKIMLDKKMINSLSEGRRLILMGAVEVDSKIVDLDKKIEGSEEIKVVKVKK